jgi:hypothetical protein
MNNRTELVSRADDGPCGEIKDAVRSLENIQIRDLIEPLGHVKASEGAS